MFRVMFIALSLTLWPVQHAIAQSSSHVALCGDFSKTSDPTIDDEQEKTCIGGLLGVASRDGCKLNLQLENGTTKTYEDRSETCGLPDDQQDQSQQYRLLAWLPEHHMFIVWVGWYESAGTLFVSSRNGKQQSAWTGLHFTPDGSAIAEINDQDGGASADYSIAIWDLDGDPVRLLFKRDPTTYESWQFQGWRGSSTALATITKHVPASNGRLVTFAAEITRDRSNKWSVSISNRPQQRN